MTDAERLRSVLADVRTTRGAVECAGPAVHHVALHCLDTAERTLLAMLAEIEAKGERKDGRRRP